ncbi:MAG: hypothetical protein ACXAC5_03720 [Promethearchaeota archaeon]|jgi:hypothetical protein
MIKYMCVLVVLLGLMCCSNEQPVQIFNMDPANTAWLIQRDDGTCAWCYAYVCECINCDDKQLYHWSGVSRLPDPWLLNEALFTYFEEK